MDVTFRGENMKQYTLTVKSTEKFTETNDYNDEKLKERTNNMTKIKLSKAVASFIDDYARNASHDEDWMEKLLVDHSITYRRGYNDTMERVKVLKDITPMKLAQILHNGWEVIKYDQNNLSDYFKVLENKSEVYYLQKINNEQYIMMYDLGDGIKGSLYYISDVIEFLNSGEWEIIDEE